MTSGCGVYAGVLVCDVLACSEEPGQGRSSSDLELGLAAMANGDGRWCRTMARHPEHEEGGEDVQVDGRLTGRVLV